MRYLFAEILQNLRASTVDDVVTIRGHAIQIVDVGLDLLRLKLAALLTAHEREPFGTILAVVEQVAVGRVAVTARTARLLVVALDGFGQAEMKHETDVSVKEKYVFHLFDILHIFVSFTLCRCPYRRRWWRTSTRPGSFVAGRPSWPRDTPTI